MVRGDDAASLVVAAVLALSSGCGGTPPEQRSEGADGWELGTQVEVIAGSLDSPPELSFHQVAWATRLQSGEIVVLDGGLRSRLTVLTSDGEFVRTIGRNGEGPGEFGWVTSIQAGADDSLFVFDAGHQRLTVFSTDGSTLRTANYRPVEGERLGSVTHLGGQTWLGRGLDSPLQGPPSQIMQDTIVLGLLDPHLGTFELLAELPSLMSTTMRIGDRLGFGSVAFTPRALHATWGGCIFVATADTSSIRVYSANGKQVASFEGPGTHRAVAEEQLDAYVEYRLRRVPEDQQRIVGQALRDAAHPESLPYYSQMLTDHRGYLWLQQYYPTFDLENHWYVLTPSGRVLADVGLPAGVWVFGIDEYGLLGMRNGDFDEEMIVVLPMISRPLAGPEPSLECQR
jgi:6-bladed beta-propeller protein